MVSFMRQWKPDYRLSRILIALPSWKVPEPPTLENNHNISSRFQRESCLWLVIDQGCHILSLRLKNVFQQGAQK